MEKIYYYSDEINEDFSGIKIKTRPLGRFFSYVSRNPIWNLLAFIIYRLIAVPFAFIFCKLRFHIKIVNKKVLRKCKRRGYFLYGNHTQGTADAYIPSLISFPKKSYIIVHPNATSIIGVRQFIMMLGAIPTPTKTRETKKFLEAIEKRNVQRNCIAIYPEAHIWPYYTKIRNFKSVSFKYPVKLDEPSFCFTVTYQKRKEGQRPKITVFVDGPFYPDKSLTNKEQQEKLRNEIYKTMKMRSQESNYEYVQYINKKSGNTDSVEN